MSHPMLYWSCLYSYIPYAYGVRSGLTEWLIRQITHRRKSDSRFIYFEQWMNFYIIYYPLYMLIMHTMVVYVISIWSYTWFWSYAWLRSYIPTPVDVTTPNISPNSGRTSQLWSMSVAHVLSPQLWKTSHSQVRWVQHLTEGTLSRKQIGRDAWLIQRSKPQHLTTLYVLESGHVSRD
jgi:hypothetical protein